MDPEVEWDSSAYPGLDIEVQGRGRQNFVGFMDRYRRAWIDYRATVTELIDAGNEVVVVMHETGRARGTDMPIERDLAFVWTVRQRRGVRVRTYGTRREAIEAVGLRE